MKERKKPVIKCFIFKALDGKTEKVRAIYLGLRFSPTVDMLEQV